MKIRSGSLPLAREHAVASEPDTTKRNEQVVQGYFEERSWGVEKLDLGDEDKNADFWVHRSDYGFLCEVKTTRSVLVNIPYRPEDYFVEMRNRRRAEIEEAIKAHPDTRLVMPREEWEYYFGDEAQFRARYRHRPRYAKDAFDKFRQEMQEYLDNSPVHDRPYTVRLDSDDCYAPCQAERGSFFALLEGEIRAIDDRFRRVMRANSTEGFDLRDLLYRVMFHGGGTYAPTIEQRLAFFEALTRLLDCAHTCIRRPDDWFWSVDNRPGTLPSYHVAYQIRESPNEYDPGSVYFLNVSGPWKSGKPEVEAHCYGELNFDAIDRNIHKGIEQLKRSAETKGQRIPRVIVLAFEERLGFEERSLPSYIRYWLREHPTLSAIAYLRWMPDGAGACASWLIGFSVYHNPWLQEVSLLDNSVFSDGRSVQMPAPDVESIEPM